MAGQGASVVHFQVRDRGVARDVAGRVGESVFHVLKEAGVKINGACDGHMGCGTCHVYVDAGTLKRLDAPSAKELDLLDYAPAARETSRLACALKVTRQLEGARIDLPSHDRNVLSEADLLGEE